MSSASLRVVCDRTVLSNCPTGFTSIIEREQLESLCEDGGAAGLPTWEDFKEDLVAGHISFPSIRVPFLFAGEQNTPVRAQRTMSCRVLCQWRLTRCCGRPFMHAQLMAEIAAHTFTVLQATDSGKHQAAGHVAYRRRGRLAMMCRALRSWCTNLPPYLLYSIAKLELSCRKGGLQAQRAAQGEARSLKRWT